MIMIGAFNNQWSLKLTYDLPFRLREGVRIESRDHPDKGWTVPNNSRNSSGEDYALITRILTSKTGGPVIVVAGVIQASGGRGAVTACSRGGGNNCEQFAKCNVRDPLWRVRERILSALGECTIAELAAESPTTEPPPAGHAVVLHTHI